MGYLSEAQLGSSVNKELMQGLEGINIMTSFEYTRQFLSQNRSEAEVLTVLKRGSFKNVSRTLFLRRWNRYLLQKFDD